MVRGSHCQNHDIMAAVAGIGVARDRAGEPQPHIALPRLQSSRHHHNDNSSSLDLLNLTSVNYAPAWRPNKSMQNICLSKETVNC
jgi:hypothetical protein